MKRTELVLLALLVAATSGCSSGSDSGGMKPSATNKSDSGSTSAANPDGIEVSARAQRVAGIAVAAVEPP
jgi:uncharacterized lipoprotein